MGQAKQRGSRSERIAQAVAANGWQEVHQRQNRLTARDRDEIAARVTGKMLLRWLGGRRFYGG